MISIRLIYILFCFACFLLLGFSSSSCTQKESVNLCSGLVGGIVKFDLVLVWAYLLFLRI
jgi:hypothetical protein